MSTEMTEMQDMINMAKGLQQSAQNAAEESAGFMKFTKFGNWVFGAEATEVEEGSEWVIHPQGFRHGFIAWGDKAHGNHGEKLGEIMVAATQPLPLKDNLDEVNGNWAQQVSMQLLCISGLDQGTRVVFNTNSVGGRKVYQQIVNAVVAKISEGKEDVAPVVTLDKDSYKHKKFGLIFTPVVEINEFFTLEQLREALADCEEDEVDQVDEADDADLLSQAELEAELEAAAAKKAAEKKAAAKKAAKEKAAAEKEAAEKVEPEGEEKPLRVRRTRRPRG